MINKDYLIVRNFEDLRDLHYHINSHDYFAFDTETTGLNVRKDEVIGLSVSGKEGEAYYMPRFTWNTETEQLDECWSDDEFKEVINMLAEKELVMWNASFDIRIVKNDLGIDLTDALVADAMLMKHTIAEEGEFSLKGCAIEYQEMLGMDMESAANQEQIELKENVSKNGGSTTRNNYEMYKADLDVMGKYACADADLTLRLANYFYDILVEEELEQFFFEDEVMPLYKLVTIPMEDHGVKLDLPLIEKTKENIQKDLNKIQNEIIKQLSSEKAFQKWLDVNVADKFPVNNKGNFAQRVVNYFCLDLPVSAKTGKYSISKKSLKDLKPSPAKSFLEGDLKAIDEQVKLDIQKELWIEFNQGLINISSKKQMGELVFDFMNIKPLSRTDKGAPQFNDGMIQHLADDHGFEWAKLLGEYNKLVKIKGAYIDRFLDNHEDGFYYFYYKQHGTISGRYGSDAQQLPRPKEEGELSETVLKYNNTIRKFFIVEEDRIFVDDDYESLEPHVFAHVSGDEGLRDIFRKGHDFYSTIAIATEKLEGVSADKKADNYLGKVMKAVRQAAKAYSLGVPYGMTAFALSKTLDITVEQAKILIDGYLDGFPKLKEWMETSKEFVQQHGYIRSQVGRIRHLPRVKELHRKHGEKLLDWKYRKSLEKKHGRDAVTNAYRDYKNGLNNARNFQIQSLSGSIVNRAAIAVTREFRKRGINAWVCAQIHDQLIFNCPKELAQECKEIVQYCMENTTKLSLTLKAPAELSENFSDGH